MRRLSLFLSLCALACASAATHVRPPIRQADIEQIRDTAVSNAVDVTLVSGERFQVAPAQLKDSIVRDGKSVPYEAVSRLAWRQHGATPCRAILGGVFGGFAIGVGLPLLLTCEIYGCSESGLLGLGAAGALAGGLIGMAVGAVAVGDREIVADLPGAAKPVAK